LIAESHQKPERIREALSRIHADLAAETRAIELYRGQVMALRSRSLRSAVRGVLVDQIEQIERLSAIARDLLRLLPAPDRRSAVHDRTTRISALSFFRRGLRFWGWFLALLGLRTLATVNARSHAEAARGYQKGADRLDWDFPRAADAYRDLARTEERHARWFDLLRRRGISALR